MFWPFTVWGFLKPIFKPHEYWLSRIRCCNSTYRLRYWNAWYCASNLPTNFVALQQYLPFTVLKLIISLIVMHIRSCNSTYRLRYWNSTSAFLSLTASLGCNSTYRLRYWNAGSPSASARYISCNSTYRLRYWNAPAGTMNDLFKLQQYLPFTVLKRCKRQTKRA